MATSWISFRWQIERGIYYISIASLGYLRQRNLCSHNWMINRAFFKHPFCLYLFSILSCVANIIVLTQQDAWKTQHGRMTGETLYSSSCAIFFRHSAVLSLPAVLLHKVLINELWANAEGKPSIRRQLFSFICCRGQNPIGIIKKHHWNNWNWEYWSISLRLVIRDVYTRLPSIGFIDLLLKSSAHLKK